MQCMLENCIILIVILTCIQKIGSRRHTRPLEIHCKEGLTFERGAYFQEGAYFPDYAVTVMCILTVRWAYRAASSYIGLHL